MERLNASKKVNEDNSFENFLSEHNIDVYNLNVESFFNLCSYVPKNEKDLQLFNISKFSVYNNFGQMVFRDPNFINEVVDKFDLTSDNAVNNVQVIRELIMGLNRFSFVFARAMGLRNDNPMQNVIGKLLVELKKKLEFAGPEHNYFAVEAVKMLCDEFIGSDEIKILDKQDSGLFDIYPGVKAEYGWDDISDEEILVEDKVKGKIKIEEYLDDLGIRDTTEIYAYKRFIRSPYRKIFEDTFGQKISAFLPIEQFYIVQLVRNLKIKDLHKLTYFSKMYGLNGLKCLLTFEFDRSFFSEGGFLNFVYGSSKSLSQFDLPVDELMKRVFDLYSLVIKQTNDIDDFVLKNHIGRLSPRERQELQKAIRKRSAVIINNLVRYINNIFEQSLMDTSPVFPSYLSQAEGIVTKRIEEVKAENILFGEMYVFLRNNKKINNVESLGGIRLGTMSPEDEKVKRLYFKNYPNSKATRLYDSFIKDSQKPGFRFFSLEKNDELLACIYSLEDESKKRVYIGGLNSDCAEGLDKLSAGNHLMNLLEDKYVRDGWTIDAIGNLRLSHLYISKRGFIATKVLESVESEGEEVRLGLVRYPNFKERINKDLIKEIAFPKGSERLVSRELDKFIIVGIKKTKEGATFQLYPKELQK